MKHIHYSTEQIERLSKDPRIKHIDQYSIRFTLEYRLSIYERVKDNICAAAVRQVLLDDGFNLKDIQSNVKFYHNLVTKFKLRKPQGAKNKVFSIPSVPTATDTSYNQFLLDSGKFVKKRKGVSFSEKYKSEIYHTYPETSIEDFLTNDGFVQSMSRRGNSQDNAPMETWFGKLKTRMIDTFARCKDYETLTEIADGYISSYNNDQYQLCLAGLSPKDYYTYITTGIYSLDKYYEVNKERLLTSEELKACRRKIADTKNKKARESTSTNKHL